MAIIKLTEAYCVGKLEKDLKRTVSFFLKKSFFETTGACFREVFVKTTSGKTLRCSIFNNKYVKETPEEILEKIKEAENANH